MKGAGRNPVKNKDNKGEKQKTNKNTKPQKPKTRDWKISEQNGP